MTRTLITGATDGIGKITATNLAKMGQEIIIHGRNERKAQQVVEEIKQDSGNENISYLIADLTDMTAIQEMVNDFYKEFDHLDVLINNAGAVLDDTIVKTKDDLEATFALNVMAPFLLTKLLLPALEKSSDGRVINMSSATYRQAKPNKSDFNSFENKSGQSRYGTSKLYVILNTESWAKKLANEGIQNVTVNVSHPGAVATNFGQNSDNGWLNNLVYKIALKVMPAPENGAITNTFLASDSGVNKISGAFFDNKKNQIQPKISVEEQQLAQPLFEYCEKVATQFN